MIGTFSPKFYKTNSLSGIPWCKGVCTLVLAEISICQYVLGSKDTARSCLAIWLARAQKRQEDLTHIIPVPGTRWQTGSIPSELHGVLRYVCKTGALYNAKYPLRSASCPSPGSSISVVENPWWLIFASAPVLSDPDWILMMPGRWVHFHVRPK